jgi:N-acetylglucosaminyldiphosphoundecaprenol N-acetyl-beta-D-mannosaminyltransferase
MQSIHILGCRLDLVNADEATDRILAFARGDTPSLVVTLGTEMVVYAQRDAEFRQIVNASALSVCDTVGVLYRARRRSNTMRSRVTGIDLISHICERASKEELPIYLLGGAEGVAADAAAILEARFPGLPIAGTHHGYFSESQSTAIALAIRASGARILFTGLGFPRQERWLARHLAETGCGAGIGVGGSFDVISGRVERAPRLWRRFGLEWLYRLLREPHRWRRQLALPHFVWLVLLDRIGFGTQKGRLDT